MKEVIGGGSGVRCRRYLVQSQHRLEVVSQLKVELARHKNQKATPQWAIALPLPEGYRAWRRTTRHKCYQGCGSTDDKWVIETNDDPEYVASAYKGLMVIERCFRTLKTTQLKFELVYHRLLRRIGAHVKICVMALLIERVAELACDQPWSQLRPILARLQATEVIPSLTYCLSEISRPRRCGICSKRLTSRSRSRFWIFLSLTKPR